MHCPSCGMPLSQGLKYCNRCGTQLLQTRGDADLIKLFEKRMDSEMEGLFWITVFGVGLILGGMFLLKKVLHLSETLIFAFMLLSAAAFLMYFGLGVWQVRRLARNVKAASTAATAAGGQFVQLETHELSPFNTPATLPEPAPSVVEHTTRTLEPVRIKHQAGEESPI